jgi:hypothetical protein
MLVDCRINLTAGIDAPIMPSPNDTLALQHRELLLKLIM